jgi:hypothetical protein
MVRTAPLARKRNAVIMWIWRIAVIVPPPWGIRNGSAM